MKKLLTFILATTVATSVFAGPRISIGGSVYGSHGSIHVDVPDIHIGNRHHYPRGYSYGHDPYYRRGGCSDDVYYDHPRYDRGHWEMRESREWIPEIRQTDRHGNVTYYRPGYWKVTYVKVWVNR